MTNGGGIAKEKEVYEQLDVMSDRLNDLQSKVVLLTDLVKDVIHDTSIEQGEPKKDPAPINNSLCPLAEMIRDRRYQIENVIGILSSVISSIQIG